MMQRQKKRSQASQAQHYVWIQERTETSDGAGGFFPTWTNVQQVSAAILPIRAQQRFEYQSVNVDATHLIKVRGRLTIEEKTNRFLFGDREFEILAVEDLQERGFVKVCTCLEKR